MIKIKNKFGKIAAYLIAGLLIALLLIKPFNFFCNLSSKCSPIILSYYFPAKKGSQNFEINFEAQNQLSTIEFKVLNSKIILKTGQNATIIFTAKNLTNHQIKIRPEYFITPENADQYITRYECLCFKEHIIAAGQEVQMPFRIKIDPAIEKDQYFSKNNIINIGFKI
jgi:cytochrome c oxidase assembly protein subunit 11